MAKRAKEAASSEMVPLAGIGEDDSLAELLVMHGFRGTMQPTVQGSGEAAMERRDGDSVYHAFMNVGHPKMLVLQSAVPVKSAPDAAAVAVISANTLNELPTPLKATFDSEKSELVLQVALPVFARKPMAPYVSAAIEVIGGGLMALVEMLKGDVSTLERALDAAARMRAGGRKGEARRLQVSGGAAAPKQEAARAPAVYQVKLTLRDVKPPVWRRLLVSGATKLPQLHDVFNRTMGWTDTHLHAFRVGEVSYGVPDPDFMDDLRNERNVRLDELAPNQKSRLVYEYDFGDGWRHDVLVEKIEPMRDAQKLPACVGGKRACPPEDVGGPWGYEAFLAAYSDPRHEQHKDMRTWAGPGFDPEDFNVEETSAELERLNKTRRARRADGPTR